jgi:anion-transporting  ArsA/GET3 family ATPase
MMHYIASFSSQSGSSSTQKQNIFYTIKKDAKNAKENNAPNKNSGKAKTRKPSLTIKSKLSIELADHNLPNSAITLINEFIDKAIAVKKALTKQKEEIEKIHNQETKIALQYMFFLITSSNLMSTKQDAIEMHRQFTQSIAPEHQKKCLEEWHKMP